MLSLFAPRARRACSSLRSPWPVVQARLCAVLAHPVLRPAREQGPKERPRLGAPRCHSLATPQRRDDQKKKSKRSFFLPVPSPRSFPTQIFHSAVAPRRGNLVIVASSKKTDLKKQGLNSIKVSDERKMKKSRLLESVVGVGETRAELSRPPSFVGSHPLISFFFFLNFLLLFLPLSLHQNNHRTTSSRPTSWASPAR